MWEDLFRAAPEEASAALQALQGALQELQEALDQGRIDRVGSRMAETRRWVQEER
jgi:prephenate dehydrogenase